MFAASGGDLLAEAEWGVTGGGISISDRGSGDIDSASELSKLMVPRGLAIACWFTWIERLAFSASSTMPDTLLPGILVFEECFFRE